MISLYQTISKAYENARYRGIYDLLDEGEESLVRWLSLAKQRKEQRRNDDQ